jgi:RNA polymerase sigma-70 factor (sigma-E family)
VRATDEPGFIEFVRARSASLLRYAALLTGDVHEAEDLLQTALVRLAAHWPTRSDDPTAYVKRVLTNLAYDRGRGLRRRRALERRLVPAPAPDAAEVHAEADVVLRALAQLSRRQRLVVVLRYVEGLTEQQAAEVAGCSVGTVKSHASRGLERLRTLVGDQLMV